MSDIYFCGGCGITLQSKDKDALGFVPASSIEKEDVLCKRCFQLKNYNKHIPVSLTDEDFLSMGRSIGESKGLIVHLIDIFDVNGTLISSLPRIVDNNTIIHVGNKIDLLPKSTNERKLKQWLQQLANEANLNVIDVFLISSASGLGMKELAKKMEEYRQGNNIYVVGITNVGKSTFINNYINESTGLKEVITTSYFPGTTLGFIEIPLDDRASLIDTPGIVNPDQMAHYVSNKDLKIITPRKEVKARTYQLNSGQTLFIGGLGRFDFIKGDKQSFVCYFANDVPIHRTKLDNADELYDKQLGKLLTPPNKETLKSLPKLTESTYKIEPGQSDIVFPGLGWITAKTGDVTVAAHSPKGTSTSIRKSFF